MNEKRIKKETEMVLSTSLKEIQKAALKTLMGSKFALTNMTIATSLSAQRAAAELLNQREMLNVDEMFFIRACRVDVKFEELQEGAGDQDVNEWAIENYFDIMREASAEGVYALYVLRKLLESESPSAVEIMNDMNHYGMVSTSYGMIQAGMADYIIDYGYKVNYAYVNFEKYAEEADAAILFYTTADMFHIVTFQKNEEGMSIFYFPKKEPETKPLAQVIEELEIKEMYSINIHKRIKKVYHQPSEVGEVEEDAAIKIIPTNPRKTIMERKEAR